MNCPKLTTAEKLYWLISHKYSADGNEQRIFGINWLDCPYGDNEFAKYKTLDEAIDKAYEEAKKQEELK